MQKIEARRSATPHAHRAGFTLIELLIVIVLIGILATIAVPKFSKVREKGYVKAMVSDLRNLAAQQEIYYTVAANGYNYAHTLTGLNAAVSPGVNVTIDGAGNRGWFATASHNSLDPARTCGIYIGTPVSSPPSYIVDAGVVSCAVD